MRRALDWLGPSILLAFALSLLPASPAWSQEGEGSEEGGETGVKVSWQEGPGPANLGTLAQVQVPEAFVFAGADDTRLLMEAMGNPVSGKELGYLAPESHDWYVAFEFDECGYVKDDEKDSLDQKAMLQSIIQGNEAANQERKRRGWSTLTITGWQLAPRYNQETHNLEWAIIGQSEGSRVINYSVRVLGRSGVMQADLVLQPEQLDATLPIFQQLLTGMSFTAGNQYAEYRSGDKIAQYGLTALITGTGIAVAAKTGLLGKLLKPLIIAAVAVAAAIKKFFSYFFGGKKKSA